ncbi:NAD(P)/FAD-dependent oxidoreductase [Parapusillimonas sp. SGNA-6]|nr:NAD(P)/FAD-dependent oxidoreductase [Parapusillimonas sp. SGNA-6]
MENALVVAQDADKSAMINQAVVAWLNRLEQGMAKADRRLLEDLFLEGSHWRDLVGLTWSITPHEGRRAIADRLLSRVESYRPSNFKIAEGRTPPRQVRRLGVDVIEAIFQFETGFSRCYGIVRLPVDDPGKAWVMMTSIHELKGHELPIGPRRPDGSAYSRIFGGDNWADRRAKEQAFADRDPTVLIIGAGQSGLSLAARLRLLGVDALCVDRESRVGDTWRKRYHSLALHNQVALNQMAFMPFPPSWPKYLPKDMVANWLENYAWAMECNVWLQTTFTGATYDADAQEWSATVRRADGPERAFKARHLVFANGIVGAPKMPNIPGLGDYKGTLLHTHGYKDGAPWKGKRAMVIGVGTSGHDIAQDLHGHGAHVTMIQRGAVTVASVKAATLAYTLYYDEGLPTEDCDLIATAQTFPLFLRGARALAARMQEMDRPLLNALAARGFKLDLGEDGGGYQTRVRRSHSGYYLNCGCSELIAEGEIGLIQYEDIDRFVEDGVRMKDGRVERADLIVAATGYQSQQEVVRELLGDEVAERVGPIWGLADDGELNNMYRPTPQPGLWFMGSGLSQARIYSHFIAMQIKADLLGLVQRHV